MPTPNIYIYALLYMCYVYVSFFMLKRNCTSTARIDDPPIFMCVCVSLASFRSAIGLSLDFEEVLG